MISIDYDMVVFKEEETYQAYCPGLDRFKVAVTALNTLKNAQDGCKAICRGS